MQPKNNTLKVIFTILVIIAAGLACANFGNEITTESSRTKEDLFNGVTYIKEVRTDPRPMVIHIVKVNMTKSGVSPLVTPPDRPKGDKPYDARTTSDFARENRVQIAINGSGFRPWYDYRLAYFPHTGDAVSPLGRVVSDDWEFSANEDEELPLILFGAKRPVSIGYIQGKAKYALSGIRMLVEGGSMVSGLNNWDVAPRTAVGNNQAGQQLIIVVVDGRQSGYSKGATLQELAQILIDNGAHAALELDGGGSSTLVVNPRNEPARVLNSPVHNGVPGRERPVATHIGIFAK